MEDLHVEYLLAARLGLTTIQTNDPIGMMQEVEAAFTALQKRLKELGGD